MSLHIYNTLSRSKEEFKELEPGHVRMYLCGPTVYNYLHVGNFRGPIFFNFVRNYLIQQGFKVTFVYNYTDVDDKIIAAAQKEGVGPLELSERFIAEFEKDYAAIGLGPHDKNPRVTEHIPQIIALIEMIIANGHAYVVDGEVFCSIKSLNDYGKLSHKNIDDLIAGARVEIGEKKKNPLDFTLWKPAKAGEPSWPSPWGPGRPGWHIECSAMAREYLGDTFDIHGGGIDLIFPHHENEIGQSESATGKPFVRYWMHNHFLQMGKDKMSKSLGNIFTAREFLKKYNGEILKFLMLSSHYRSPMDFSDASIGQSIHGLGRIYSALVRAQEIAGATVRSGSPDSSNKIGRELQEFRQKVKDACDDDFNTPEVMAEVFKLIRWFNGVKTREAGVLVCQAIQEIGQVLSLFGQPPKEFLRQLDDLLLRAKNLDRRQIDDRVQQRLAAKKKRDFAAADQIRNDLVALGIELRDSPQGTEWEVRK